MTFRPLLRRIKNLVFYFILSCLAFTSSVLANDVFSEVTKISALEEELPAFQGDCGKDYVEVFYDSYQDYDIACEGIQRAEIFAKEHLSYDVGEHLSHRPEKPIKVLFGDATSLQYSPCNVVKTSHMGIYDVKENIIVASPRNFHNNKKYLDRFTITDGILTSIITHEVIHHIHDLRIEDLESSSSASVKTDEMAYEILAYIAQIETMDTKEKELFLSSSSKQILKSKRSLIVDYKFATVVNHMLLYQKDPNTFATGAYRHWENNPEFVAQVFNGEWTPRPSGNAWERR